MSIFSAHAALWRPLAQASRSPRGRQAVDVGDLLIKAGIVLAGALILVVAYRLAPWQEARDILLYSSTGRAMAYAGAIYGSFSAVWTFWRLYLAIRYRPVPTVEESRLPAITVIVPAYNEGALVGQTLRHLAAADYPADRMQIIVVDDGSEDDTWSHIESAAEEIGPRISAIRCPTNRGKRWALWEGFRRATGEIFVTVDSDSLIARDALPALVSPLVEDASVGAVAGKVAALNLDGGLIPRMLNMRYVMTFDYKRAAQSKMGGGMVLCCAGALAAYRRTAVMPILDKWLHQTFRGGPARAGEDHAMTNFILRQGHKVRYQRSARVVTNSPTKFTGLCKMFLRWGRSNIRESIHTGRYIFTSFRPERKIGIRFNYLMGALGLFLPYPFLICALVLGLFLPSIFGLKLLASCVVGSLLSIVFCALRERTSEALFMVPYSFYSTFLLWWIWPYALLTCQKSVWMTRTTKHAPAAPGPAPSLAPAMTPPPVPALASAR
jgi:hyaluronan synthase